MAHDLMALNEGAVTLAMQLRALEAVLQCVRQGRQQGIKPVVEIDLDLTSLTPRYRTIRALQAAGAAYGVAEFADPLASFAVLPGYTDEAWEGYLQQTGLRQRYPALAWHGDGEATGAAASVYSVFHGAYWTNDWLIEDQPTPGLGEFVRAVEDAGGTVVFISGRWLEPQFEPSRQCLMRAGVPSPNLMIGNPDHSGVVPPGTKPLSDAEIKARRQPQIRAQYGQPVAVFDDRIANRQAIIAANDYPVLGVGIALPGFSYDAATDSVPLRVSTFERLLQRGPDVAREPYLAQRYGDVDDGRPYRGGYQGVGRNGHGYVLPRVADPALDGTLRAQGYPRTFAGLLAHNAEGSMAVDDFMAAVEATIPADVQATLRGTLERAESMAAEGLADAYPQSEDERRQLWHFLCCSWLHSRDVEVLMGALGYPLAAMGAHDMKEEVAADALKASIAASHAKGNAYSPWFLRWADKLPDGQAVNIGFLNPSLTVSAWRWRPDVEMAQDAMDAHRLSSHHEGDGFERYDPVEATMNYLLHHREGVYGIDKKPVMSWAALEQAAGTEVGAAALVKTTIGIDLVRDGIALLRQLEREGKVMPWGLVQGASL